MQRAAYAKGRYRRAVAREEQGKLREAKEDYDTLLRESPDHDLGRKRYAVLEVKLRKQREDAPRALRRLALTAFGALAGALLLLDWLHR